VEARFSIVEFPQQLATLRQPLTTCDQCLRGKRVPGRSPHARVYFTSGTQEAGHRPIMKSMAEAFGVPARAAAVAVSKPKSYFLRDFFTEVVFPTRTSPSAAPGSC